MMKVEELRRMREESANVAYQEFATHTRLEKTGLFCFFEGKDNGYYYPRIKQHTDLPIHPIKCGGRDKVLKVYQLINYHIEYQQYKKAFFIDNDFHARLPQQEPPIFETPCYSIENLYVSIEVFKEIVKNQFYLSEVSKAYQTCITLFQARQNEFHEAVWLFNAWYACLIDIRDATGKLTEVQLADKFPKGFLTFSLAKIEANYNIVKIKELFPLSQNLETELIAQKMTAFEAQALGKVLRGKYEMEFLIKLIDLMITDSDKEKTFFTEKIEFNFHGNLNNEKAITAFSAYAETPNSLSEYLIRVTHI